MRKTTTTHTVGGLSLTVEQMESKREVFLRNYGSTLPRWVHQAIAFAGGYFWLPCKLCGREFGGHERVRDRRFELAGATTIPDEREAGLGWTVCTVCAESGKALRYKLERGDLPAWVQEDPLFAPLLKVEDPSA